MKLNALLACVPHGFCYTTCMTKKNIPTLISGQAHPFHAVPAAFKTDQEITFDGGRWGIVDAVIDGMIWVIDQDGGDHELSEARID